jgi:hypothetical protein
MQEDKQKIDLKNIGIKIPDFVHKENLKSPTQFIEAGAKKENYLKVDLNTANTTKRIEEIKAIDSSNYGLKAFLYLLLTILTLSSVYFVYFYSTRYILGNVETKEQNIIFENALVRADSSRVVSIEGGATKEQIKNVVLQTLYNEKVDPGKVTLIIPSYLKEIEINGKKTLTPEPQRGDDFLFTFADHAPLTLRTIVANNYAFGETNNQRENKSFLALSVVTPQDATREFLKWENQMYADMKNILKLRDTNKEIKFKDLSYNNHQVRIAEDLDGTLLVYGFGAPRTIIIAPDTETFDKVYNVLK